MTKGRYRTKKCAYMYDGESRYHHITQRYREFGVTLSIETSGVKWISF